MYLRNVAVTLGRDQNLDSRFKDHGREKFYLDLITDKKIAPEAGKCACRSKGREVPSKKAHLPEGEGRIVLG